MIHDTRRNVRKILIAAALILCGCSYRRTVHPDPATGPIRHQVVVAADTISYEYTGDSATASPVVVLLHGFGASLESWTDLEPMIAAHHPVLRLDLKGFGLSSKPRDDRYSARDQADVVAAVLRKLDVRRPVLVGHSFGGGVAYATYLRLRSEGDQRTAALVLIDASVSEQELPFYIIALRSTFTRWLMYTFTTADWRAGLVLKRAFATDSAITPERIRRYSKYFDLPGSHYAYERSAEQIVPPDIAELEQGLKTIAVPTLAIWGTDDRIVPVDAAERLRRDVPGIVVKLVPATGHVPHEERPAETARILLDFVTTLK